MKIEISDENFSLFLGIDQWAFLFSLGSGRNLWPISVRHFLCLWLLHFKRTWVPTEGGRGRKLQCESDYPTKKSLSDLGTFNRLVNTIPIY